MNPTRPADWSHLLQRTRQRLTNDPTARPLPEITVETGPTLRGWTLRLALLLLVPALFLTAASRTPDLSTGIVWTLAALFTILLTARPTPATAAGALVLAAVLFWGPSPGPDDGGAFDPWSLLVTLLGYLVARLTWWAAHVPLRGRAEIAALLTDWRRDLVVLGGTAVLAAFAMLVSGATLPGAVLLAALGVAGIAFVALATHR
ncbi:hypothetical protein [Promicromonospora sp. MEB111]|uniref:hypothetical protein n=1 Tax=Promicromonospora sp. MEB111 TaxID=3040301 RepID=UPI00254E0DF1|nr:hypothetical protein [Promicromonospora sp. MEB111]